MVGLRNDFQIHAKRVAAFALAGAALLLSAALLICIDLPQSSAAHVLTDVFPNTDVHAADSEEALQAASHALGAERERDLVLAETAIARELSASPLKPDAWARLSYVCGLEDRRMSPRALAAFQRSYAAAPLDPDIAVWRIHFGLEVWDQLSPEIQTNVRTELETMWTLGSAAQARLIQAVQSVKNPRGLGSGEIFLSRLGWAYQPQKVQER